MDFDLWTKRTRVKGLMVDCPFGTPLPECPAIEIRRLPLTKRVAIVEQMPKDGLDEFISYHESCAEKRDNTQPQE